MNMRSPSGRYTDWPAVVERARAAGGKWVPLAYDSPVGVARTIRQRRHPALHLDAGRIEVDLVHPYVDEQQVERANIYVRYVP